MHIDRLIAPPPRKQVDRHGALLRNAFTSVDVRFAPLADDDLSVLSPAQKSGLRFERRVHDRLKQLAAECGWRYEVQPEIRYDGRRAYPDGIIISSASCVLLFEIKQTWVDTRSQLGLYKQLLHAAGYENITPISVVKNLTNFTPRDKVVQRFSDLGPHSVWRFGNGRV